MPKGKFENYNGENPVKEYTWDEHQEKDYGRSYIPKQKDLVYVDFDPTLGH